jgi:hypothetical protein
MNGIEHEVRPMSWNWSVEEMVNFAPDKEVNEENLDLELFSASPVPQTAVEDDMMNVSLHQNGHFEGQPCFSLEEPKEEPQVMVNKNLGATFNNVNFGRNFRNNNMYKCMKPSGGPYLRNYNVEYYPYEFRKSMKTGMNFMPIKNPYNNFNPNYNPIKNPYNYPPNNHYSNNFNMNDYSLPNSHYSHSNNDFLISEMGKHMNLSQNGYLGKDEEINESKKRKSMDFDLEDFDEFKLPPSKTPIIDAILYCAIKGESGITIEHRDDERILFKVTDYDRFYEKQKRVCSKQNPTDDESSRIKTIQRWFKNFPTKKERSKTNETIFFFSIEKSVSEDKFSKIGKIIEKLECTINVNKRRRTK